MRKLRIPLNKALHCGCLIATIGYFFVVKSLPLLGTFGAESGSLFSALFGPLFAFVAVLKLEGDKRGFAERLNQFYPTAILYTALFSALIFSNTIFTRSCSDAAGFLWYLAFLLPPLILNILLGTAVSCITSKKRIRLTLLSFFYIVYFGALIYSWWQEPAFRLFSHLSIIFTSDLLSGIILNEAILVFRLSTLVWCFFLYAVFAAIFPSPRARIYGDRKDFGSLILLAFLAIFAVILQTKGIELAGKSYQNLAADYSLSLAKDGIVVNASPSALTKKEVASVLNEALFWQYKLKQKLGLEGVTKPITIWLHATSEDKYLYTGARHVHFALPHRREIHLSGIELPHPVLGHELAHIYLGEYSSNRMKIPGVSDWLPNLGISEGLATYLSQELNVEDEVSLDEMAKALWQSNIRINASDLFSINPLHFAKLSSAVAYLFAGAFFEFYLSSKGTEEASIIKNLAQHGALNVAIPFEKQAAVFQAFEQYLEQPVSPRALALVNMRWQKEGILTKNCAKDGEKELNKIRKDLWLGEYGEAKKSLNIFSKENNSASLSEAKYWLQNNRPEAAQQVLSVISADKLDVYQQNSFRILKARCLILLGLYDEAQAILGLVNLELLTYSQFRYALSLNMLLEGSKEAGVIESLTYLSHVPTNNASLYFAYTVGSFNKVTTQKPRLGRYLFARLLMVLGQMEHAHEVLALFFAEGPDLGAAIENEALFMKASISFALNHFDDALEAINTLLTREISKGRLLEAKDLLLRISINNNKN